MLSEREAEVHNGAKHFGSRGVQQGAVTEGSGCDVRTKEVSGGVPEEERGLNLLKSP